jgi:hypothetical protein
VKSSGDCVAGATIASLAYYLVGDELPASAFVEATEEVGE